MLLFTLLCSQLAFGAGFYHPSDTAQHSELFQKASEVAGAQAANLETRASGIAVALNRYEEALDFLPEHSEHTAHFRSMRTTFNREFAVASAFVHTMLDDFDTEFSNALETALSKKSAPTTCLAQRPVGGRVLPGIRPRLEANPECVGDNLNKALATHMDADPALQDAINEILALKWPEVSLPNAAKTPITEGSVWLDTLAFFEKLDAAAIQNIRKEDAMARDDLLLEEVDPNNPKAREEALKQSRSLSKATRAKRQAFAAPLLEALASYNEKASKKGMVTYGLCPIPQMLGGCTGQHASQDEFNAILTEKRIQKALP